MEMVTAPFLLCTCSFLLLVATASVFWSTSGSKLNVIKVSLEVQAWEVRHLWPQSSDLAYICIFGDHVYLPRLFALLLVEKQVCDMPSHFIGVVLIS